jgi:hypothetical protein
MIAKVETIPHRPFSSPLPTGEQELFCYLRVDQQDAEVPIEKLTWKLTTEEEAEIVLMGTHRMTEQEQEIGLVPIAAFLPPQWEGGQLIVEIHSSLPIQRQRWEIAPYRQSKSFRLPLAGQVLVVVGHRIGEVHRSAWQIPAQQFAWDLLPLSDDGLRLLQCPLSDSLRAADFTAFGQEVLAPGSGRVVSAEDGHPDLTEVGALPEDVSYYLEDLRRAFGNHVILDHGAGVWSFLGHLRQGCITVQEGQEVVANQVVGALGNSGFSSGPHLHFQFMDGPDLLSASPLPVALDVEGETYAPQAGEIVSSD